MKNVANYIISLKNAVKAKRRETIVSFSRINKDISRVLKELEYVEDFKEEKSENGNKLKVLLKYDKRTPRLTDVVLISKPSLKKYVSSKGIRDLEKRGNKTLILSTSEGVMSGRQAQKKGLGGEALFAIW